jgi:hypothetical protein
MTLMIKVGDHVMARRDGLVHVAASPENQASPSLYPRMWCFFTFETQTKPGVYTKFNIDYSSTVVSKSVPVSCLYCLARTK